MSNVARGLPETNKPCYITKTDAVYDNRTTYSVISKLVKEGKIALHLINGRIMLDAEEVTREVGKIKNRFVRPSLF
jgi:hypothetical protein